MSTRAPESETGQAKCYLLQVPREVLALIVDITANSGQTCSGKNLASLACACAHLGEIIRTREVAWKQALYQRWGHESSWLHSISSKIETGEVEGWRAAYLQRGKVEKYWASGSDSASSHSTRVGLSPPWRGGEPPRPAPLTSLGRETLLCAAPPPGGGGGLCLQVYRISHKVRAPPRPSGPRGTHNRTRGSAAPVLPADGGVGGRGGSRREHDPATLGNNTSTPCGTFTFICSLYCNAKSGLRGPHMPTCSHQLGPWVACGTFEGVIVVWNVPSILSPAATHKRRHNEDLSDQMEDVTIGNQRDKSTKSVVNQSIHCIIQHRTTFPDRKSDIQMVRMNDSATQLISTTNDQVTVWNLKSGEVAMTWKVEEFDRRDPEGPLEYGFAGFATDDNWNMLCGAHATYGVKVMKGTVQSLEDAMELNPYSDDRVWEVTCVAMEGPWIVIGSDGMRGLPVFNTLKSVKPVNWLFSPSVDSDIEEDDVKWVSLSMSGGRVCGAANIDLHFTLQKRPKFLCVWKVTTGEVLFNFGIEGMTEGIHVNLDVDALYMEWRGYHVPRRGQMKRFIQVWNILTAWPAPNCKQFSGKRQTIKKM